MILVTNANVAMTWCAWVVNNVLMCRESKNVLHFMFVSQQWKIVRRVVLLHQANVHYVILDIKRLRKVNVKR